MRIMILGSTFAWHAEGRIAGAGRNFDCRQRSRLPVSVLFGSHEAQQVIGMNLGAGALYQAAQPLTREPVPQPAE